MANRYLMKKRTTSHKPPRAAAVASAVVERLPLSRLKPAPYNPRVALKPGMPEYEKLKRSIVEFGYAELAVWNRRTGHVVGGHQRLVVLGDLGRTEADVIVVDLPLERE